MNTKFWIAIDGTNQCLEKKNEVGILYHFDFVSEWELPSNRDILQLQVWRNTSVFRFFTTTKEVMFLPMLVCLFVFLFVFKIT